MSHRAQPPGGAIVYTADMIVRSPAASLVLVVFALSLVAGGLGVIRYHRPLPAITVTALSIEAAKPAALATVIPWPAYGQAAVGVKGHGVLATHGPQTPIPTASVAKVMTALAVLDKKPLKPGQAGPMITITKEDMAQYDYFFANDGSLVAIREGQRISQYDALEALLLPSANNMAFTLARWAFGSTEAYSRYANELARKHGLQQSNFADASGFSPETISTAADLVRLGEAALRHPVIAELSAKRAASIPVHGDIYNTNGLIGRHGINGIKTGVTDQAGGVFLVSADRQLSDGQTITIVAAVMGADVLERAMLDTIPILDAAAANLVHHTPVSAGQTVGSYTTAWDNRTVKAVASRSANLITWKNISVTSQVKLKTLTGSHAKDSDAGSVTLAAGDRTVSVPLVLDEPVNGPSFRWRILGDR